MQKVMFSSINLVVDVPVNGDGIRQKNLLHSRPSTSRIIRERFIIAALRPTIKNDPSRDAHDCPFVPGAHASPQERYYLLLMKL